MLKKDKIKKKTAASYFISMSSTAQRAEEDHLAYLKRKMPQHFTLIELLVKITCFSGDLAKAHEV